MYWNIYQGEDYTFTSNFSGYVFLAYRVNGGDVKCTITNADYKVETKFYQHTAGSWQVQLVRVNSASSGSILKVTNYFAPGGMIIISD